MRKYNRYIFYFLFFILSFPAWAQTTVHEQRLYSVIAGNDESRESYRQEMEIRFGIYNNLFRFDPSRLAVPLNVRVFDNRESYDSYVITKLGSTIQGAVYIHYDEPEQRELVIHRGGPENEAILSHQAFVQYIRAFVPNPPSWILHGFAIHFSALKKDLQGNFVQDENLYWLERARLLAGRNSGGMMPSAESVLYADERYSANFPAEFSDDFKVTSWALVTFLLSANRDYYRILAESFMLLSSVNSAAENTHLLRQHFSSFLDMAAMERDFRYHLSSRRSFSELMEEGQSAYSTGSFQEAKQLFLIAIEQHPNDPAPYYFLGLLAHDEMEYGSAEVFFNRSLERGADPALISYALGVNALASGQTDNGINYLYLAAGLDPLRFRSRVDELLRQIMR